MDGFADQDVSSVFLVQALQPCGEIHDAAEDRVVHPFGRSEIADDRFADVDAVARVEQRQPLRLRTRD